MSETNEWKKRTPTRYWILFFCRIHSYNIIIMPSWLTAQIEWMNGEMPLIVKMWMNSIGRTSTKCAFTEAWVHNTTRHHKMYAKRNSWANGISNFKMKNVEKNLNKMWCLTCASIRSNKYWHLESGWQTECIRTRVATGDVTCKAESRHVWMLLTMKMMLAVTRWQWRKLFHQIICDKNKN